MSGKVRRSAIVVVAACAGVLLAVLTACSSSDQTPSPTLTQTATVEPTAVATLSPTATSVPQPTNQPTNQPTIEPTIQPETPTSPTPTITTTAAYTNTTHNYSLHYPTFLHVLPDFGVATDSYFSTAAAATSPLEMGQDDIWITVGVEENDEGLSLSEWISRFPGPPEEEVHLTVAGVPAVQQRLDLAATGDPHGGYALRTYFAAADRFYTITGLAFERDTLARYEEAYQGMVSSFRFLPPKAMTLLATGLSLLYVQNGTLFRFAVDNLDSEPLPLPIEGEINAASLNQDGRFLAHGDRSGLNLLDVASGEATLWLAASQDEPVEFFRPRAWSSAGHLLLQRTWLTENTTPVSVTIGDDTWRPLPIPATETTEVYGLDSGTAWSPSGTQLALAGYDYGIPSNVPGLTVLDVVTGDAKRIVTQSVTADVGAEWEIIAGVYQPAWSPDGEWIVIALDGEPDGPLQFPARLHLVRPDGSELIPLPDNGQGRAAWPLWTPDGSLYYSLNHVSEDVDGIYRYDPAGQSHTLLIPGSDLCPISHSPGGAFLLYGKGCGFNEPHAREALKLWTMATGQIIDVATGEEGDPVRFAGWQMAAGQPTAGPDPGVEWIEYQNEAYGFTLSYPADWGVAEVPNKISFTYPGSAVALRILVQRADEALTIQRTGVPAGDLIEREPVTFLGGTLSSAQLVYEGKTKFVFYNNAGIFEKGDLLFALELASNRQPYGAGDIPEWMQATADDIIESVRWLE